MTVRVRPATALLLSALVGTMLWWPARVAASVEVDAPPVAVDDPDSACFPPDFGGSFPIPEDSEEFAFAGSCNAIANDTDSDGSIVAWQIVALPLHGTLNYLPDHPEAFGYTPAPDWSTPAGTWLSDSFRYQAIDNLGATSNTATYQFWVAPFNDPPSFLSVPTVEVAEDSGPYDESWAPYVSAGPSNESDQTVTFHITSGETHGVVNLFSVPPTFTADGHLTFTPGPNEHGYALITGYLQDDGGLEHYSGVPDQADDTSDPETFMITVGSVNDAPDAVDDTTTVAEDATATAITVLSNDSIAPDTGETLGITSTSTSSHGTVVVTGGGTGLTYQPSANYSGPDSFTYTISDGGLTDTATVDVTITAVNDNPVATNDAITVLEDQAGATTVSVLANDADVDGDAPTVASKTDGAKGAVVIVGGGAGVTYKPNANAFGSDTYTYTISDGHGGSATATVNVTITPLNDPPNAINDGVPTTIKIGLGAGPVPIAVLANDSSSPDGPEVLRIISVTQGANGAVAIIDRGRRLTYDPAGATAGIDVFQYTISDGHGATDTATVQVQVGTDATGPIVGAPVVTATRLMRAGTTRLVVSWVAYDPESGVASSVLQVKRDGAATWTTISLADHTATRMTMLVAMGHTYQFQVRATNGIGMASGFKIGALVSV